MANGHISGLGIFQIFINISPAEVGEPLQLYGHPVYCSYKLNYIRYLPCQRNVYEAMTMVAGHNFPNQW